MSDENTVGGVSVDVTANLGTYKADMASAKATAADLDSAFSKLTVNSQNMVKAMVAAGVSAKDAANTFGTGAGAAQKMAAFTELAAKAKTVETAATTANTAAHVANTATVINSRVAYESLVAVHEILSGRFNRLAGTSMILGQALLGNAKSAELLKAAITPTGAAIAGVTAIAIAGAVALYQYEQQQRALLVSSAGLGARSGVSSGQGNQIAGQDLFSFKSSVNDNLKGVQALTAAGVTNIATIRELNAVTADYALLTGEKAKDAEKDLASAMKDPVKGAEELNAKLSFLTGTQLQQITSLTELGDKTEAQTILTDALRRRTEEAKDAGVEQDSLFHKIAVGASDAATGIGKLVDAELKWGGVAVRTLAGNPGALPDQIAADRRRIENEAKLQEDSRNRADSAAGFAIQQQTPEAKAESERNKLLGQRNTLIFARNADEKLGNADGIKANAAALNDVNRALDTYEALSKRAAAAGLTPEAEKTVELYRLEGKALNAKTDAQKKAIAEQKEALALTGKVMSQADANALISSAGERVKAKKDTFATKDDTLEAQTRGELALAEAYGVSDAAAMKAAATTKALVDEAGHHRTALQAEKIAQDELNLSAAKAASESAKKAADLRAETAAMRKADDAVASGAMSRKQADEAMKEELSRRPLEAALANASSAAKATLSSTLKELTKDQKAYNDALERSLAIDTIDKDKDDSEVLRARLANVNASKAQREVAVAQAQRRALLGSAANTPEGQTSITSAGNKAKLNADVEGADTFRQMTLEIQKETEALQKQGATMGMTLEQADKFNTEQKLLLEATRAGVELTDKNREAIDKLAAGYARAAQEARTLAEHQKGLADAAKTVANDFESEASSVIFDGKKPGQAARDLAKTLGKDAFKATTTGEGPLAGLFGTDQTKTVGGMNGGVFSQIAGSIFGVGKGGGSAKPTGAAGDPLFVKSVDASGSASGGGGGIMGMIQGLLGGSGGIGGMGGAPGADVGGSLTELAGLFHTGTSYVGTPHRQVAVDSKLFIGAPRLHRGLAPGEFPAILQEGEGVTPRSGRAPRGGKPIVMNISANDAASFGRSQRQIERAYQRRAGRPG